MVNSENKTQNEKIMLSIESALASVRKALNEIRYGEVVVKVEGGKPIWWTGMRGRWWVILKTLDTLPSHRT